MTKAVNKVPTPAELNRLLARSPKEVDLFDKLDAQPDWPHLPNSNLPFTYTCLDILTSKLEATSLEYRCLKA